MTKTMKSAKFANSALIELRDEALDRVGGGATFTGLTGGTTSTTAAPTNSGVFNFRVTATG